MAEDYQYIVKKVVIVESMQLEQGFLTGTPSCGLWVTQYKNEFEINCKFKSMMQCKK